MDSRISLAAAAAAVAAASRGHFEDAEGLISGADLADYCDEEDEDDEALTDKVNAFAADEE